MTAVIDLATDDGLRQALREVTATGAWDSPDGRRLLDEVRLRLVRHAKYAAAASGQRCDRGMVDDLVAAAWAVMDRYPQHVQDVNRPWAYLMAAARRKVMGELRAHHQLVSVSASERAASTGHAPQIVVRVGASASDLAAAFRHEWGTDTDHGGNKTVSLPRSAPGRLLTEASTVAPPTDRRAWYTAFVRLLVAYGAGEATTTRAVDHLSVLFTRTKQKLWETAARKDPVLARLGLSPDQCGALVALLAGSRRERTTGRADSLLAAVRAACEAGVPVELSVAQRRRVHVYTSDPYPAGTPDRQPALLR